jgi:hypothetical protein
MSYEQQAPMPHSQGWIAQVWISFAVSVSASAIGIFYLSVGPWARGFLAISFLMAVSSAISLSKTLRDMHESNRLVSKIDEAKVTKLLTEHPIEL